jgi:predicted DNA-binding transcriptional regulator YafY
MRADRLLAIVLLLQGQGPLTAPELARRLEVSVRTIYRDMVALGTAGIPLYADATGYQLVNGYRTQLTGLTADEARGLVLSELPRAAAQLGLAGAAAAVQLKLAAALPDALREQAGRMRQRFHLDAPGWYQDGDSSEHLAAVADAVWHQRPIEVRYENWRREVTRRLDPYGLVLKAGKWYLVARTGVDLRTFRVNQIRELTPLPGTFDWPDGFDLATYWRQHVDEFRSRLYRGEAVVRVSPHGVEKLFHFLGERVGTPAARGEPQPDGWVLARIPIETEEHAAQELLRLGAEVEVIEPPSLRTRLAEIVAALAAHYDIEPRVEPHDP